MRFAAVAIGIPGVQRIDVEFYGGLSVTRCQHYFLKSQIVRVRSAFGPIISVVAYGNDCVSWIEIAHAGSKTNRKPRLRRDRPRIASRPVLVIAHEHEEITRLGVGLIIPVGIVERRGNSDQPASRLEGGANLAEECQHIFMRRIRDLLKVNDDPLEIIGLDKLYNAIKPVVPLCGVRDETREVRTVPIVGGGILDHGQNGDPRLIPPDQV